MVVRVKNRRIVSQDGGWLYWCYGCSKYKESDAFGFETRTKYHVRPRCKQCEHEENISPAQREYSRNYGREWMRRRRKNFNQGKKCKICGSTENLIVRSETALIHDIHPWNHPEKEGISFDFYCCACWFDKHTPHGTNYRYRTGCRCPICKAWRKDAEKRWRKGTWKRSRKKTQKAPKESLPEFWPFLPDNYQSLADTAEGIDLLIDVYNAVPRQIQETLREDICQDIVVAILEGRLSRSDLKNPATVKEYINKNYRFSFPYQEVSIDAESDFDNRNLLDRLSDNKNDDE